MLRSLTALAAIAPLLTVLAPGRASGQTVDELVAKNLQARGGLDQIKAIHSIRQVARLDTQGMQATVTMYGARPNLTRQELHVGDQTVVSAFDGTTAWTINPLSGSTTPRVITGPELEVIREESEFDSPFVDYKTRGFTIDLVGTETVDGRQVYHLKVVSKNGAAKDCYLDGETFLETRIVLTGPVGTLEQRFSDYRDVQGIKMPFAIETRQNGVEVARVTVEQIEVNVPVDVHMFGPPGSAGAKPSSRKDDGEKNRRAALVFPISLAA